MVRVQGRSTNATSVFATMGLRSDGNAGRTWGFFCATAGASNVPFASVTVERAHTAGDVDAESLQFAQPDDIARKVVPTGKKTIAALITGRFQTAFPDGAPKEDKKDDATTSPTASAGSASAKASADKAGWPYKEQKIFWFLGLCPGKL